MYIHASSIFLLPQFLSFSSLNFHPVVYPVVSSIFSRSEILRSIERWIDHERTSHFGNPFIFALCSFLFPISRLTLIRHRDHGHEFLVVRHILPRDHGDHPCSTGIDSHRGYTWLNISFVCVLFYIFVLLPFCFILFIDLSRWQKGSDERRGRLEGATRRTYFGYRERFSEETKKQALQRKMWKNRLGKWKKLRSQMENRFVKWTRFWGNEEIENWLSRTKGKVF